MLLTSDTALTVRSRHAFAPPLRAQLSRQSNPPGESRGSTPGTCTHLSAPIAALRVPLAELGGNPTHSPLGCSRTLGVGHVASRDQEATHESATLHSTANGAPRMAGSMLPNVGNLEEDGGMGSWGKGGDGCELVPDVCFRWWAEDVMKSLW